MAGIAGIISFGDKCISELDKSVFSSIKSALRVDNVQVGTSYSDESIFCAIALPVSSKLNDRFVLNKQIGVLSAVDGYIHISEDLKASLCKDYALSETISEYEMIPYLYNKIGHQTACHLTGSFNLFCYNINTKKVMIANDRLGFPFLGSQDFFVVMLKSR